MALRAWDWWNPATGKSYKQWFDWLVLNFPKSEPGATVKFVYVPFGTEYVQKLLSAFASGDPPDVYHSSIIWGRDFFDRGVLR